MIGYIYNIYLLFTLISISKVQSLISSSPCDDSFPLVDTTFMTNSHHTTSTSSTTTTYHDRRNLIAIPNASNNHNDDKNEPARYYETGEYYAPLCNDGIHIDIRHLRKCNSGACWDTVVGVSCAFNIYSSVCVAFCNCICIVTHTICSRTMCRHTLHDIDIVMYICMHVGSTNTTAHKCSHAYTRY